MGAVLATRAASEPQDLAAQADPRDWPYWRGPEFNGISRETGLPEELDPDGDQLKWQRTDLGGRSTPIVMNGKLYSLQRDQPGTATEGEKVVCLDAATGETLWETRFNIWSSDVPDTRVGWSSVVGDPATGRVYALGVCDYFVCLDAETGETLWSRPLHEQFGMLSTYGGRTNFPVIAGDLVIISGVVIGWGEMARPAHRILGLDKRTGEVVWFSSTTPLPYDTTYSAPTVTVLGGQAAFVIGSGDGKLWALQPRTGLPIWNFELSRRGLNVPPLVVGDRVFMSHSEENVEGTAMGAIVALDGRGRGELHGTEHLLWQTYEVMAGKSAPLYLDGRLYVIDDGAKLQVIDAETGERLARKPLGTMQRGSPLYADGKIYTATANGRWYVLEPDEKQGVKVISRGRYERGEECPASPIAAHGRVYVQTTAALYCFEDESQERDYAARPAPPQEPPASTDPRPAHLQVVPCELLLRPGDTQPLTVRLYNARGQLLGTAEATFEVDGPGEVSSDGVYHAPADARHTSATVVARLGDLQGQARIRIVPELPWKFEFTGLQEPPIPWVGARYRHVVRKVDGNDVMVKLTTIPKGTRSRCWFGHTDLHDYTIEADALGRQQQDRMPDIGLIAQGYTMDLQGQNQALQIRSWVSHDYRVQKTIPFAWQPDVWYRLKLQAASEDGQAVVRGKVWPRDEQEPQEWTIELVDPAPNVQGSPGLYGNAREAELYLDNIEVYANETANSEP